MTANPPASLDDSGVNSLKIPVREVRSRALPEGVAGEGLGLLTDRGEVRAILHRATGSRRGVIWVCGARGGFGGPASGLYAQLAEELTGQGISSLRLDYRYPNAFPDCVTDLLAGIAYFADNGCGPVALVGHSFGGAVVIAAGAFSLDVAGVVSLSPQTYGANVAGLLSPKPLLVVHGKSDTRLPYSCGQQIYQWAKEPKQLVLYDGAGHRLEQCREELAALLTGWIPATLTAAAKQ